MTSRSFKNAGNYYYTVVDDNDCLVSGDEVFFSIEDVPELFSISFD